MKGFLDEDKDRDQILTNIAKRLEMHKVDERNRQALVAEATWDGVKSDLPDLTQEQRQELYVLLHDGYGCRIY